MQTLKVRKIVHHTAELFELQLERGDIRFKPGNCLALCKDQVESRPYSISSGVTEELLRFLIRIIPHGEVSSWLAKRQPGDEVRASEPFGWFRPEQVKPEQDSVFIATGTGIAPFLSTLRSSPERPPLACLYGVSLAKEAFALEELESLANFQLAVSRDAAENHFHGRVTGLLTQLPLGPQIHYYLCGLDDMIDEVSEWLELHNIDYTQIHREVFFYADEAR